jgi:release factor glutamine methyltransferase
VYLGDLYEPLPPELRGRLDVVLGNVPYVPQDEISLLPPEARDHEPRGSLDGGCDGLDVLRRAVHAVPQWLAPGGAVFFETSERQVDAAVTAVRRAGLVPETAAEEESTTVVVSGRRPS